MKRTVTIDINIEEGWYLVPTRQVPQPDDIILVWQSAQSEKAQFPPDYRGWSLRPDRRRAERRKELPS
jgi:hypothetical protein